jgi:hypothetical protein
VLVDLPGLNDPNPAREHVTKQYLNEARYIWLICNSQTGIDRVFTQLLRENALLFRLFLEGRLGEFSVVTTRVDDINLEAILAQMGVSIEEYDGDYTAPLAFRRKEIASHVHKNLLSIAADIVSKAAETEHQEAFLDRIRNIPVFSVSTAAYLHSQGLMPLYKGMRLSGEESHLPLLIAHLTSITLQQSYQGQVEASCRRLEILHDLAHRFFLTQIQSAELDSATAKAEFEKLSGAAHGSRSRAASAV